MRKQIDMVENIPISKQPKFWGLTLKYALGDAVEKSRNWTVRKLGGVPIKKKETGNLVKHAINEMEIAWPESDDMQDMVKDDVIDLISVFSYQGHSGFSASYVANVAYSLMKYENLTEITGESSEWFIHDFGEGMYAQNKRCSSVFMRKDGSCYDIEGRIFYELNPESDEWVGFTSYDSRVDITFPYDPNRIERVYLDENRDVISRVRK